MSYTLTIQPEEGSLNAQNPQQQLKKIFSQNQYEIVWLKHFQNFYGQESSYFILIQTKHNLINKQTNLRIRKAFPKQLSTKEQKRKSQQNPQSQKQALIQCTVDELQLFDLNRIIGGNFIHENAFIVLKDPLQLYFLTKKSKAPIKIILQPIYDLVDVVAWFSLETNDQQKRKQPFLLTLYGLDKATNTNKLLSVNLMTFDTREINQSKDYSPKPRKNQFRMFHDDRLYVFGGQNQKQKQIQQLLWSFDLQKGYWFALEMNYNNQCQLFQKYISTVYDSGKIIILKEGSFYLFEIYQCKITKLEFEQCQQQFNHIMDNSQILGMITFQKRVYFYGKDSILPTSLSLKKVLSKQ